MKTLTKQKYDFTQEEVKRILKEYLMEQGYIPNGCTVQEFDYDSKGGCSIALTYPANSAP